MNTIVVTFALEKFVIRIEENAWKVARMDTAGHFVVKICVFV